MIEVVFCVFGFIVCLIGILVPIDRPDLAEIISDIKPKGAT
jgi:hypothetical protein